MLVYDRETVLQVVHNRGHGFHKYLPCRGTQIATYARSTSQKPNKNPTRHHDKAFARFINDFRGHPTKLPAMKLVGFATDRGFCDNGYKRLGTRKCDWAC